MKPDASVKPPIVVDTRGTMCPVPIRDVSRVHRNASVGDVIEVWVNDPAAKTDIEAWARQSGNEVIAVADAGDYAKIWLRINKSWQDVRSGFSSTQR